MATTLNTADLTVNIQESITLNGAAYDQTTTHTISDCYNVMKRVYRLLGAADHTILDFKAAPTDQEFDADDIKYIRITNLDDTNTITVSFSGQTTSAGVDIEAGESTVILTNQVGGVASVGKVTTSLIEQILVTTLADNDIEVMIALA